MRDSAQPSCPSPQPSPKGRVSRFSRRNSHVPRRSQDHGGSVFYLVRTARNEARTRTSFFSIPELGIRHVRTPGPFEKYPR